MNCMNPEIDATIKRLIALKRLISHPILPVPSTPSVSVLIESAIMKETANKANTEANILPIKIPLTVFLFVDILKQILYKHESQS